VYASKKNLKKEKQMRAFELFIKMILIVNFINNYICLFASQPVIISPGDVYWVRGQSQTLGSEISKVGAQSQLLSRPWVILTGELGAKGKEYFFAVPSTTRNKMPVIRNRDLETGPILLGSEWSIILEGQIKTISKKYLDNKIGSVHPAELEDIRAKLRSLLINKP
jgi:mRNA-degrading endonuclease toxin of MazEF toxin-antitoxin module